MRLLSVDFDYFFPIPNDKTILLYDWGHKETMDFMKDGIWSIRAAGFLRNELELPKTTGLEKTFWNRFKFAPNTKLYISDSHSQIYQILKNNVIKECWNFDAHHDAYETKESLLKSGRVDCQNWATAFYLSGIKLSQFYPEWKTSEYTDEKHLVPMQTQIDTNKHFIRPFDAVFVCRSSAWVPSWVEDSFWDFLGDCHVKIRINLDDMAPREFNIIQAKKFLNKRNF